MEGTSYGLRISMPTATDEAALLELLDKIPAPAYHLPEGRSIALDLQSRSCSRELLMELLRVAWDKGMRVSAWLSSDRGSLDLFRSSGLCVEEPLTEPPAPQEDPWPETTILHASLRSGQRIEAPGDVLLWGHLNGGAEIVAGGNVIVAGKMTGVAHAGHGGRQDVFILAGCHDAEQLRLAHRVYYQGEGSKGWGGPVLFTLGEGEELDVAVNDLLRASKEPWR